MQLLAPDLAAQQNQLARQQQMAELLRQNGAQDDGQTEVVSGWAIPKGRLQPLAKLAQAIMGGRMQQGIDDKQAGIAKALSAQTAGMFGLGGESAPAAPAMPEGGIDPNQTTEGAMNVPAAMPQQGAPQAAQQPQMSQQQRNLTLSGMSPQEAFRAYAMDPNGYMNSYLKQFDSTDMMKNDRYLGIDAGQSRQAELAKRVKDGTMSYQPGQLNVLPDGQKIVAPNFETGVAGGFDAQGNPIAREIQGSSQIAASRAGSVADATARANAAQDMITVNIDGRPVMMTRQQAVGMSNSGVPQPAMPQPAQPVGAAGLNNMTPAQKTALMRQAEAQFGLRPGAAPGSSVQGMPAKPVGGIGIAGQTDAEKEQQVGAVRNKLAIEKSRIENAQSPEQQQKLVDAQSLLGLLDEADPLLASGIATSSAGGVLRDKVTGALGVSTDASKQAAKLASIGGALVSKMPKMSGPQSDKDVALYKEMAGRLGDSGVPIGDRQAAAQVLRMLNEKYLAANQGSIANSALEQNTGKPAQYIPKVAAPTPPPKKMQFKYLGKE